LTTIDQTATMAPDPAMITIRPIAPDELDAWLTLSGTAPPDERLARRMRAAWQDATGGSTLTFVAEREGRAVGRLAYVNAPAASVLPGVLETSMVGLWLPWNAVNAVEVGRRLIVETLEALPDGVLAVDGYANPEYMLGADVRRAVFEAAGMPLFQEKEGFLWQSSNRDAPLPWAPRLDFMSAEEVGEEPFARVMARAVVGTLDRQDRYYRELVGPEGWGREILGFLGDGASSWLIALEEDGTEVGYVLIGGFDEPGRATIVHIGVVPESRGHGYVDELLQAGNAAARRRGFDRILSDVDVDNPPMLAAMERNGHSAAATTWHVWHHRLELGEAARPRQSNPARYSPRGSAASAGHRNDLGECL